ncbi:MAG: TRAP transporter substrate-binding protein [Deltaproteobacteria bacterium]|nr:TRAP transporter substrate-binding protein [Deltaproteobacteria bacterium]
MKKGLTGVFLGVFLVVSFSIVFLGTENAAALETSSDGKIVIRLSHANNINFIRHKSALKWKEALERESKGKIEVKIYPASQIYKSNEELNALLMGNLDMAAFGGGGQMSTLVPEWELFNLVFFWPNDGKNFQSAWRFKNSEIVKKLLISKVEQKGLKFLGFVTGAGGPSSISTTKRPIRVVSDFKGLKINTLGGWQRREAAKSLGFSMVTVPKSEVGQALALGTIDGEWSTVADCLTSGYPVKYMHWWPSFSNDTGSSFVMSMKTWNSLPENIRKVIDTTVTPETQKYTNEQVIVDEAAAVEELKKRGVAFIEPSPGTIEGITSRLSYIPGMYAEKFGEEGKALIETAQKMIAQDKQSKQ